MISATDKLECVERELRFRQRVYPRMVENGRMTKRQSERELELMGEIVEDYRKLAAGERLL